MIEKDNKEVKLKKNWEVSIQGEWWGRKSKLPDFIIAFEEFLKTNEEDVIYLTDNELRICVNDLLEEKAQISDATFENWKAGNIKESQEYLKFLGLYKKALLNQKRELFKCLKSDPQAWQRIAWIIERKFSEWNLKNINENKTEHSGTLSISNVLNELWDNEIDLTK